MLLHPEQVQDIGYIIRDIMLQKQQNDVLSNYTNTPCLLSSTTVSTFR
jgi:hypothetical protein